MERYSRGVRVQVFFGEADQAGHRPLYEALLEYLRREGAAGATITRGVAGFGADSKIKTAAVLRLSMDLPMVMTWIDAPGRVERLLPGLRALTGSGIVTVDEVEIAAYGGRRLEQLRFDLDVRDAMTQPVQTVGEDAPVADAVRLLIGRPYRALPVVDGEGRLVGVISNADLVARAGLEARLELLDAMSDEARNAVLARLPGGLAVRDAMSATPVSIAIGRSVGDATRIMSERHLKRLPVVDEQGRVVGIISRAEVLRAVAESFPRAADGPVEHPGARSAGELMRTDTPVVPETADLGQLLDAVASTRLNRAIVVDREGRVRGVVSDADVLRAVGPGAGGAILGALMRTVGRPAGSTLSAGDLVPEVPRMVAPDAPLAEAARLMTAHRRKVLPVVDPDGRLLGILDRADLLHASRSALDEIAATEVVDDEE